MQRLIACIICFVYFVSPLHANKKKAEGAKLTFDITERVYTFSTVYDIDAEEGCIGSVVKSPFRIRTNYDLYDHKGAYEGLGICRIFFTLGLFYTWATEIDVYDVYGKIGFIDGQAGTTAAAKFSIYDGNDNRVGIAYLDNDKTGFTIVDPNNEKHHLASFRRNFVQDTTDNWTAVIYEKDAIDLRILKVFGAFCVDSQDSFKKDL